MTTTTRQSNAALYDSVAAQYLYRAQRRRARTAAKADARRRSLINLALTALMLAGFVSYAAALHGEEKLLEMERNGYAKN